VQTIFLFHLKSKSRILFSIRKLNAAMFIFKSHFWFLKTYMQNKFSSQKIVILEFAMLNKLAAKTTSSCSRWNSLLYWFDCIRNTEKTGTKTSEQYELVIRTERLRST
jgi:hypothetical protein